MTPKKSFQKLQYQLAAHLRSPHENLPPENLEDKRLAIYRRLFFRNVDNFISSAFPVLKEFYTEEAWHNLIRKFYARHHSHSPYFNQVSKEFLAYLESEHQMTDDDPLFMCELAHYEWIELELSISDQKIDPATINPNGNLLDEAPVLSPLTRRLIYRWPVHRISPDFHPRQPGKEPTYLVVCRNQDDEIIFVCTNFMSNLLLDELAHCSNKNGFEHIEKLAINQGLDLDTAIEGGKQTLEEMRQQDIILGTWKKTTPPSC